MHPFSGTNQGMSGERKKSERRQWKQGIGSRRTGEPEDSLEKGEGRPRGGGEARQAEALGEIFLRT